MSGDISPMRPDQAAEQIKGLLFPEADSVEEHPQPEAAGTLEAEPDEVDEEGGEEVSAATVEEESEGEPETEQESEGWTLAEIAEALERSPDELLETLSLDVDGQPMTLAELRKARLREADYTRKTQELAEQRKRSEAEAAKLKSEYQTRLNEASAILQLDEQRLMHEYNSINWKELESEDREEFLVQRAKFEDKAREIQNRRAYLSQHAQKMQQEQRTQWKEGFNKYLQDQGQALAQKLPEYFDQKKGAEIQSGIRKYLTGLGYTSEEINGVIQGDEIIRPGLSDHRVILMAHKARLYDELQAKKPELEKKAKKVPKMLKPSSRKTVNDREAKARNEKLARLRKTGKPADAQSLIRDLLFKE